MKLVLLLVLLIGTLSILGQTSPANLDLGGLIAAINIGLAGVGLLAFARGWIVPGYIHNQDRETIKEKDQEIEVLRKTISESVIPELSRGKDVNEKMIGLTQEFMEYLKTRKE